MNKGEQIKEIIKGEMIGLQAEVVDALNKSNIGIKGKITDETKNMITIHEKKLIKMNISLKIKNIIISGQKIQGRPHERIKTKVK
jgi:ribonuclease P protein subunit POP4